MRFAGYLAEDSYDIFPDGVERTKLALLEFLREAYLKDYQLSDFRVIMLNKDTAVVYLPRERSRRYSVKGNFNEQFRHIRLGEERRPVIKRLCGCVGTVNCCLATVRANSLIEKPSGKILPRMRKTIIKKIIPLQATFCGLRSAPPPWVTLVRI